MLNQVKTLLATSYQQWTYGKRSFSFQQKHYRYFVHPYNWTWQNERAVEVSLGLAYLEQFPHGQVLEVGNVMSHYGIPKRHTVVDKYEIAPGVINTDVVNYRPAQSYDLILSLSTLEHVGWDEEPKNSRKFKRALQLMSTWLAPDGLGLVTLPLGYNPHVDHILAREASAPLLFKSVHCMRRISAGNTWEECAYAEIAGAKYGEPFAGANGLAIGFF